jgi:hypothetical protein
MGRTISLLLGVAAVAIVLWSVPASAAVIDPATLHLGPGTNPGCTTPITGCAGSPNLVTGNDVTIFQQSGGGGAALPPPQLLLLAVPNDTTDLLGATDPITKVTYTNPFPGGTVTTGSSGAIGVGQFGINNRPAGSTFFYGSMMGADSLDIYSFLGLGGPGVDNSNNIANYTGADAADGITATEWGIYGFALTGDTLGVNGVVDALFSGFPPTGTFAAAYGQDGIGHVYVNAFTNADLILPPVSVPEPSTLSLMSLGAVGLALLGAIRARREDA